MTGKQRKTGFTLIELLVVMAIIGTLIALVTPQYFGSLQKARETALQHDLAVMREAIQQFYSDRERYPANLNELVDLRYIRRIPVDPITESPQTWLGIPATGPGQSGIKDIISGATGNTRDGVPYAAL